MSSKKKSDISVMLDKLERTHQEAIAKAEYSIITKIKEIAFDLLKKKTSKWAAKYYGKTKEESKLSAKASAIQKFLDEYRKPFGCNQPDVAVLMSILTGEKIVSRSSETNKVDFSAGVVLVPTGSSNSHDYKLNKPVVCVGTSDYMLDPSRLTGKCYGNHMINRSDELRPATDAEIESLVKSCLTSKNTLVKETFIKLISHL